MKKKSVGLLELETAVLECFLEKTPLSPLGVNIVEIFFSIRQTLGAKTHKKCCHLCILEAIVFWLLAYSVKAQRTTFCSPPTKLLKSFVFLTNNHSLKRPLAQCLCYFC
jgi:hypothetical protein